MATLAVMSWGLKSVTLQVAYGHDSRQNQLRYNWQPSSKLAKRKVVIWSKSTLSDWRLIFEVASKWKVTRSKRHKWRRKVTVVTFSSMSDPVMKPSMRVFRQFSITTKTSLVADCSSLALFDLHPIWCPAEPSMETWYTALSYFVHSWHYQIKYWQVDDMN